MTAITEIDQSPYAPCQGLRSAWQGGGVTICLTPGQEVGSNPGANDRGDSHTWTSSC
jgi:hypothetical protein